MGHGARVAASRTFAGRALTGIRPASYIATTRRCELMPAMNGRTARCAKTLVITSMLLSCGGDNTPSQVQAPGAGESAKTQAPEAGADVLQDKEPLDAFNAYLDGFHFASGDMRMQMEAHHYCGHLNEDVIQCVLFD